MKLRILFYVCVFFFFGGLSAQHEIYNHNKFKQLHQELPTPNTYRTASGAPGHEYWQQKADYVMDIRLDDENQRIYGEETITYTNNSPDALKYLWLQLDQNVRAKDADGKKIDQSTIKEKMSFAQFEREYSDFDGGFKIEEVKDRNGKALPYTINGTMMRIDLPSVLSSKGVYSFKVKWWYNVNDRMSIGGRSGYEYFEEDGNYLYTIAQFYPRMCMYSDYQGWQNKQFLGSGEFTLSFGDYTVNLTVPSDHVIASTGVLQNPKSVMTSEQLNRWEKAKVSDMPVMIITEEEAIENEKSREKAMKTWTFKAQNVRDFGWASSRKFIWDAMGVKQSGKTIMAMSYYPKEGNPLWEQYSTKAVAQTLETYSKHTFDYPYPVAISVHTKWIGMEYPMICFNGGRPEADGTYSERTKHGMISVIIHEVGHNYFPMIVASDERQWTWMDEGLNTFLQYLTEQEWDRDYPSRRGEPRNIVDYMKGDKDRISPIMTNSESLWQFGNNAYGKPATALNILRETIMGRELFDFAFKEYSQRWMFKHPEPADLFRTMEDASAVDLDWFWRGWFFTNEHVDISMDHVRWFQVDNGDPDQAYTFIMREQTEKRDNSDMLNYIRNKTDVPQTRIEKDESLNDFYTTDDRFEVTSLDRQDYKDMLSRLNDKERKMLAITDQFYEITFSN
ncbi:MAG: M1 family metallopeptidase, partial [Bacteroidetes bacterium]|nr:M1 family metallopeptidase [Bacteroidota bacterium]